MPVCVAHSQFVSKGGGVPGNRKKQFPGLCHITPRKNQRKCLTSPTAHHCPFSDLNAGGFQLPLVKSLAHPPGCSQVHDVHDNVKDYPQNLIIC